MARPCTACRDPRRPELDAALAAGEPFRAVARHFAPLSRDAIRRHRPHVGAAIVRAAERREERQEETIFQKVERLEADARRLGERAEREGDIRAALVAVDKLLDVARLMREVQPSGASVDVNRAILEAWQAAQREELIPAPPPREVEASRRDDLYPRHEEAVAVVEPAPAPPEPPGPVLSLIERELLNQGYTVDPEAERERLRRSLARSGRMF